MLSMTQTLPGSRRPIFLLSIAMLGFSLGGLLTSGRRPIDIFPTPCRCHGQFVLSHFDARQHPVVRGRGQSTKRRCSTSKGATVLVMHPSGAAWLERKKHMVWGREGGPRNAERVCFFR